MNVQHHRPGSPAPDSHATGRRSDLTRWRPPPVPAPAPHNQASCPRNKYRSHDQQVPFSRPTSTVLASNKYRSRGWVRALDGWS